MFGLKHREYDNKIKELEEALYKKDRLIETLELSLKRAEEERYNYKKYSNDLERQLKEMQEHMKVNIEGKTIAEYTRPEIIDLVSKYKNLIQLNESIAKSLDEAKKQFEFDKQIDRKGIEIEFLNKYSQKQDHLMTLLATKAPVQNMLIDKKDVQESRRDRRDEYRPW